MLVMATPINFWSFVKYKNPPGPRYNIVASFTFFVRHCHAVLSGAQLFIEGSDGLN